MKTFTFSGMATFTARFDFDVTVTAEDISEDSVVCVMVSIDCAGKAIEQEVRKYSVEDVEAWTDEQVRAYVEEHMLMEEVNAAEEDRRNGGGYVYENYCEYDDDMEMVVGEHDGEE